MDQKKTNTRAIAYEASRAEWLLRFLPLVFLVLSHALIVFEDTSRMFWPYLVTSYLMAVAVYFFEIPGSRRGEARSVFEFMFPRQVWFSPSAVNDYVLFIVNYVIYFHIVAILLMIEPDAVSHNMQRFLEGLSLPHSSAEPGLFVAIIYTICFLLLTELFYYITHRAYHEIPILWEFHKVHHSAEVMTPLTYIRAHPLDLWIQNFMKFLSAGICSGIFLYFYPNMSGLIMVAGIDAGIFIYYVLGANLHHSHIWMSFGPWLERVFISPAQHQIHHSDDPKHYNTNYGSMLAVWDWLFGSLYLIKGDENIKFGLGDHNEHAKYDSVWKLYAHPIKQSWKMLRGRKV